MGYGTRNNGQIKTFWPDDTEDEFFIAGSASLEAILDLAKAKWPGIELIDIHIEPQNIHTDCLTYDLYDSGDYTQFLRISRI
jgi:hypothetical protein